MSRSAPLIQGATASARGMRAALADAPKCRFGMLERLQYAIRVYGSDGAVYVSELARAAGKPMPAVSRGLRLLEQDGMVERRTDPQDRRKTLVRITPAGQHALQECEHYGVYSNLLEYLDENDDPLPFTAEALAGQQKPELLLCTTAGDARFLYDLAGQLGWLEGDAPVRIAAVAENPELAQALVDDGVAVAASYYDVDQITQVAGRLALNALNSQFAGQGLELQPDETGRFFIPFGLVTTIEDE